MYYSMLEKVTKVINQTTSIMKVEGEDDEMYNLLFNPEAYWKTQALKKQREERRQKLIAGATALAASGEAYYLLKRSGIIGKLANKIKK